MTRLARTSLLWHASLILVACSHGWAQPTVNLQLAVWARRDTREAQATIQIIRAYQQRHPEVRINTRYQPDDGDQDGFRLLQRWCGKHKVEAPDLVVMADQWLDAFAGSIATVDKGIVAPFAAPVRKAVTRDDRTLGVPWVADSPALLYRSDILAEQGVRPPTTWDDLRKSAETLGEKGKRWGFGLAADRDHGPQMLLQLLWAEGGDVFDGDGKLRLETPELTAALGRLVSLAQGGGCQPEVLAWAIPELLEAFAAGRVAMMPAGRQLERTLSRRKGAPRYAVARWPKGKHATALISVTCMVGLNTTQKPEAVADLLRFIASAEAQKLLADLADAVPARPDVARALGSETNSRPYVEALDEGRPLPPAGEKYGTLIQALDMAVCYAVKGRCSPEEALKEAAAWARPPETPLPGLKPEPAAP